MTDFLVRRLIKDCGNINDPAVRARYGAVAGGVGIFLNLCLFAAKFAAGLLTASIAITADAFNNLSDAGSSVVTFVGFRMAGAPADREHPFGHGRIEYLSGLAVSVAILMVGLELAKNSFLKILHPEAVAFSTVSFAILIASNGVKLWMCYFNRALARRINSSAMRATSMDSLTDAVATTTVAVGIVVSAVFHINIDGWSGMAVACFILYTGYTTARDSLSPLLGSPPDADFVHDIEQTVLAHPEVSGIHDLIVHDYGPGRRIISLHAEMPCTSDILAMHDAVDVIELELRHKFGCDVTIHMDPLAPEDDETRALRDRVADLAAQITPEATIHDFRVVKGTTHTNLVFDLLIPHGCPIADRQIADRVREGVRAFDGNFFAVVRIDKGFL